MKNIVITGSSGRIGRALYWQLSQHYEVTGIDTSASSSTNTIADIRDLEQLKQHFEGVDTVFHAAALHAPHVGLFTEKEFYEINVHATESICKAALEAGVSQVIFTSTTALYGYANQEEGKAVWVNEQTTPKPRTIYHETKLEAERVLKTYAGNRLKVSVMRMSRCFPEPAPMMAVYRLHRGVDYRDVANAHVLAGQLETQKAFDVFVVSGNSPFHPSDCTDLFEDAASVIQEKYPLLGQVFKERGWQLPSSIDRVYDASYCQEMLGWRAERGPMEVIEQYDRKDFEVLPPLKENNR